MKIPFLILVTLTMLLLIASQGFGQIAFTNESGLLNKPNFVSYVPKAVVDMNNDGLDDIIRAYSFANASTGSIYIEYQQPSGQFTSAYIGRTDLQLSMTVADVDRNGHNDLIVGGQYDGVHMFKNTGSAFTQVNLDGPAIFMQAANLADINNDGWLDYFACHDEGLNQIWGNDKTGNLKAVYDWIDLATVPVSNNSGNYGSVWADFDNDGDLDLYVIKCSRYAMNDPEDPRRLNMLFVNDGSGHYTEQAAKYGLRPYAQGWTADFQDIDNDGDLDCFISNHKGPSMLMENDGTGHFTDITTAAGIGDVGDPLQGLMRDFDNDGYVDILIAGNQSHLYHNNGNRTFTEINNAFDANTMGSFAIGDLNHDGFLDVYASYLGLSNSSGAAIPTDKLWLNTKNGNHFLSVSLKGTVSNPNGVGARLTIYTNGQKQIREVRAGEGYGVTNSLTQYFGLGTATTIDRLEVKWPSGIISTIQKPQIDQTLVVREDVCTKSICVPITITKVAR
ncbi:CRTAC1 family protein [Spirosoma oryzicola]|uniref:CRTAC1 family protein n=1 Tax=Spirosoma oryzicola TaxID=2898794 RepID=UPI001E4E6421|nr:CRTAC1 family protein [Spirosoma oryzicola]UHG94847.1 CRTAC1 family protein [Spirosoma oryzicola]